jgi:hypothetical protein
MDVGPLKARVSRVKTHPRSQSDQGRAVSIKGTKSGDSIPWGHDAALYGVASSMGVGYSQHGRCRWGVVSSTSAAMRSARGKCGVEWNARLHRAFLADNSVGANGLSKQTSPSPQKARCNRAFRSRSLRHALVPPLLHRPNQTALCSVAMRASSGGSRLAKPPRTGYLDATGLVISQLMNGFNVSEAPH